MADEQQKIKDYFTKNLKATEYVSELTDIWKDVPEIFRFMMVFMYDVFRSGRFKGSKVLDIGSGALVHSVASASEYFPNIVMSDYVEDNIEQLKGWLRGEQTIKQFLDVQAGLEGYGNDMATGRAIIESRIRQKVKRVTRCDVLIDGILLEKDTNPETSPPFDVVTSCLCLEVAPADVKGYAAIFKRISALLRPGGGLIICGFFQGHEWNVGDKLFHHIQHNQEDLLDALNKADFGKIQIKTLGKENLKEIFFQYDKLFCVAAEKLR